MSDIISSKKSTGFDSKMAIFGRKKMAIYFLPYVVLRYIALFPFFPVTTTQGKEGVCGARY